MREYNIPNLWKKDIATCGTYPDAFSRNLLWYDWTETQKLHAQSMYNPVFDRLEELCNLMRKHASYFETEFCAAYLSLNQVINIDCSKQYSCAEMLKLVEQAIKIKEENFREEIDMLDYDTLVES